MTAVPHGLRIDYGGDQFTVSGPTPRLSWCPSGESTYELEATIDGVRHVAVSNEYLSVDWPWEPLRSCQRVSWRVRGAEWSEPSSFEAGLLDQDWSARWISPYEADDPGYGNRPAYVLSTGFELSAEVESARLYATALGVYEAFVNGQRAGTAELTPGSTSYDRTLYAQAMDVTESL